MRTSGVPDAYVRVACCARQRCQMRSSGVPDAYVRVACCAHQRCQMRTSGLPVVHVRSARCVHQGCQMRTTGVPDVDVSGVRCVRLVAICIHQGCQTCICNTYRYPFDFMSSCTLGVPENFVVSYTWGSGRVPKKYLKDERMYRKTCGH